jgi:hypothetical protein
MLRPTIYIPSRLTSLVARARVAPVERRAPPERPPPAGTPVGAAKGKAQSPARSGPEDRALDPVGSRGRRAGP